MNNYQQLEQLENSGNVVYIKKDNQHKMNSKEYNIRFSQSLEDEIDDDALDGVKGTLFSAAQTKFYRYKQRYTFITKDGIQFDLTLVKESAGKSISDSNGTIRLPLNQPILQKSYLRTLVHHMEQAPSLCIHPNLP